MIHAENDEGGGFRNHNYLMALLNDVLAEVLPVPILTLSQQVANVENSWAGTGALRTAPAVTRPWSDARGATSDGGRAVAKPPAILPAPATALQS